MRHYFLFVPFVYSKPNPDHNIDAPEYAYFVPGYDYNDDNYQIADSIFADYGIKTQPITNNTGWL